MSQKPPLLTLCMIVRNGVGTVGRCVGSVREWVDEVVVVDHGSEDGTVEVVQSFGARVIPREWSGDFSAARNEGLEAVRGGWVLVLDADEWMERGEGERLRRWVEARREQPPGEWPGCWVKHRSVSGLKGARGALTRLLRVFPSDPGIRYEFPVHEQVVSSLERQGRRLEELDVEILHDGYVDPAERERKQWRNLELFRARLERGEALGAMGRYLMGGCLWDLKRADLALEVYRVCLVEAQAEGRGDLAVACWVRIAGALWRLGRREEAREASRLMAAAGVQHPEALLLRVKLAFLDGDRVGAERLLGELVRVPDQVWLPPCDGGMVRMKAELWLIRGLLAGDGAGEFCEWLD